MAEKCPTCGCQFNRNYHAKSLAWQIGYQLAYSQGLRDWTTHKLMKLRSDFILRFWKAYERGYYDAAGKTESGILLGFKPEAA